MLTTKQLNNVVQVSFPELEESLVNDCNVVAVDHVLEGHVMDLTDARFGRGKDDA